MRKPSILIAVGALALTACTADMTPEQKHELGCFAGTMSGAVVGGLLGSTIGGGTGNVLATAAGAGAGGFAGNRLSCK